MASSSSNNNASDANELSGSYGRMNIGSGDSPGGNNGNGEGGEPIVRTEEEYANEQLTLRAIVSSKEAGVIIGKAGKNVADLREETGVRAGVSKVVTGVHDRVLTVTGSLAGIAKAYKIVAKGLLDGLPQLGMGGVAMNNGSHGVRLLISHNQMGTIIGRQGLKIKQIQDQTGVRMVAQKEMLPQSTERIVEVQGTPESIEKAVWEIGKCLIDDQERGYGTVLYNPAARAQGGPGGQERGFSNGGGMGSGSGRPYRTGHGTDFSDSPSGGDRGDRGERGFNRMRGGSGTDREDRFGGGNSRGMGSGGDGGDRPPRGPPPTHTEDGEEIVTQNISIPSDMVGCIIGRQGVKISEIRKSSGARISIAKAPHDESGERMFTITGSNAANEKALYLLYENLEAEKNRRQMQQQE